VPKDVERDMYESIVREENSRNEEEKGKNNV
jgi:hypothetical protein